MATWTFSDGGNKMRMLEDEKWATWKHSTFHCYEKQAFLQRVGVGKLAGTPQTCSHPLLSPYKIFFHHLCDTLVHKGGFLVFPSLVTHHYWGIGLGAQGRKPKRWRHEKVAAQRYVMWKSSLDVWVQSQPTSLRVSLGGCRSLDASVNSESPCSDVRGSQLAPNLILPEINLPYQLSFG